MKRTGAAAAMIVVMFAAVGLLVGPGAARASGKAINVSGTVFVDYWHLSDPQASDHSDKSVSSDISVKMDVDVREDLNFSVKACFACHGLEVAHAHVDFTPKSWFNVQLGRVQVPFGDYSSRYDQGGHRTASAPLIFDMGRMIYLDAFSHGVLPIPYVETGIITYGQVWPTKWLQVGYAAYAVAGMKGIDEIDFSQMRQIDDNNRYPAGGGRLTMTVAQDAGSFLGDATVGASYTSGKYDKANSLAYTAWGLDASAKLGPVFLRAEYAARRTDLPAQFSDGGAGPGGYFDKFGYYVEAEHPLGRYVTAVYRVDELWRRGPLTPSAAAGELSTGSRLLRYTLGAEVRPVAALFIKASYEHWRPTDFPVSNGFHIGMGGEF